MKLIQDLIAIKDAAEATAELAEESKPKIEEAELDLLLEQAAYDGLTYIILYHRKLKHDTQEALLAAGYTITRRPQQCWLISWG